MATPQLLSAMSHYKDPAALAAEVKRLEAELERKRLEEQLRQLQEQLAASAGVDDVEESEYYEEIIEDEEEIIEEIIEEEIIEEEIIEEPQPHPGDAIASVSASPPAPVAKRKLILSGRPKYKGEGKANPALSSAIADSTQKKPGVVRRMFGLGVKKDAAPKSPMPSSPKPPSAPAPAVLAPLPTAPLVSTSATKIEISVEKPSRPLPGQPFKQREIAKVPGSPAGQETPIEKILGPDLYVNGKLIRRSTLACSKDTDLVMLYFGSKWNRECKEFYPALKDFYCTISQYQRLECVYVSCDRSLSEFKDIFAKMPFPAMPTGTSSIKNELAKELKVIDTPTLVVLDTRTGHVITTHAVQDVLEVERNNFDQANNLVETWKAIIPIPFSEVKMDARLKFGKLERNFLYWQE